MKDIRLMIAKELNKIAKALVAKDYEYIYDPEHKKHPGGGYQKTEKGWQKGKQEKEEKGKNDNISYDVKDFQTKVNIARNPNTSPETLDKLADSNEGATGKEIKIEVALNDNTSSKTLDKLSNDEDYYVRFNVAFHPNTSVNTIKKLANDKHFNVRYAVAKNPNTPVEIVKKLTKDRNPAVKNAASKALSKRQEIKFDITKLSPELREKVKDWDAEDIAKFIGWLKKQKEEGEA